MYWQGHKVLPRHSCIDRVHCPCTPVLKEVCSIDLALPCWHESSTVHAPLYRKRYAVFTRNSCVDRNLALSMRPCTERGMQYRRGSVVLTGVYHCPCAAVLKEMSSIDKALLCWPISSIVHALLYRKRYAVLTRHSCVDIYLALSMHSCSVLKEVCSIYQALVCWQISSTMRPYTERGMEYWRGILVLTGI